QLVFRGGNPGARRSAVAAVLVEPGQQVVERNRPPAIPPLQPSQATVDYDAVQPGGECRVALEGVECPERKDERLLHRVGALRLAPMEPAGDGQHGADVLADQGFGRAFVAGANARDQFGIPRLRAETGSGHQSSRRSSAATNAEVAAISTPCRSNSRSR